MRWVRLPRAPAKAKQCLSINSKGRNAKFYNHSADLDTLYGGLSFHYAVDYGGMIFTEGWSRYQLDVLTKFAYTICPVSLKSSRSKSISFEHINQEYFCEEGWDLCHSCLDLGQSVKAGTSIKNKFLIFDVPKTGSQREFGLSFRGQEPAWFDPVTTNN